MISGRDFVGHDSTWLTNTGNIYIVIDSTINQLGVITIIVCALFKIVS